MSETLRERIAEVLWSYREPAVIYADGREEVVAEHVDRILSLLESEPVAHAVMADGQVLAANRNVALLESDRARLVRAFPEKDFTPGLVPLYTEPT